MLLYKDGMNVELRMDGVVIDTGHWESVAFDFQANMFVYLDTLPFDFDYDPPSTEYRLYVDYDGVKDTLRCGLNEWRGKIRKFLALQENTGEIICYGSSNFIYWLTMSKDLLPYPVHNHTAGVSSDAQLVKHAPELLYAFNPSVVILHVSTADLDSVVALYEELKKNLPEAKFIIAGSVPSPSSADKAEAVVAANAAVRAFCEKTPDLYFCGFEDLVYDSAAGTVNADYFMSDNLHLNRKSRIEIAKRYLIPILDEIYTKE
ncbi:MAG: hypothetical protein K6E89_00260 [Sphaerochaetaceae bacterium]|nr:hypothetical protein [Sphaerochaetaceae bacterium]